MLLVIYCVLRLLLFSLVSIKVDSQCAIPHFSLCHRSRTPDDILNKSACNASKKSLILSSFALK